MAEAPDAAFARVFRAEYAALVAYCVRRVTDHEVAKDLVAETFRVAWTRWGEPRRSDRAWLFGVARNLIGNEYTRRARARTVQLDTYDVEDGRSASAFDALEVHDALSRLSPSHQEVLRLTYWDGLSAGEIAELLDITTAAVWIRMTRARRAFATAWQDHPPRRTPAPTRSST